MTQKSSKLKVSPATARWNKLVTTFGIPAVKAALSAYTGKEYADDTIGRYGKPGRGYEAGPPDTAIRFMNESLGTRFPTKRQVAKK